MLGTLIQFKVQASLVLEYKKIEDQESMHRIFYSSPKLIANDWVIDNAFGSMHQRAMTKIINSVCKYWIVKTIVEYSIKVFAC